MEQGIINLIIGGVIGGVLGFGGSLLVQRWTQERAWRREYDLKTIDKIYAPLYEEILHLKGLLEEYNGIEKREEWPEEDEKYVPMDSWDDISSGYLYHMILDKEFRGKLDNFYKKISGYANDYVDTGKVIAEITKKILKSERVGLEAGEWDLIRRTIFLGEKFDRYMIKLFRDEKGSIKNRIFKQWKDYNIDVPEDFFDQLLSKSDKDPVIQKLRNEQKELISQCDYFLMELARRIEEPWKV